MRRDDAWVLFALTGLLMGQRRAGDGHAGRRDGGTMVGRPAHGAGRSAVRSGYGRARDVPLIIPKAIVSLW